MGSVPAAPLAEHRCHLRVAPWHHLLREARGTAVTARDGARAPRRARRPSTRLDAMRHARPDDLVALEPLLQQLRQFDPLVERTPGSFYLKSKGYLHFHID